MMLDPSVSLNDIDASLQELSTGNQKCDAADDDDDAVGVMIPMCRPCFAGNSKLNKALHIITRQKGSINKRFYNLQ